MKHYYYYELSPIDYGWEYLMTVERAVEFHREVWKERGVDEPFTHGNYLDELKRVLQEARKHGWEGDFTVKPRLMVLPPEVDEVHMPIAFVWKQYNNGQTFIASEVEIPHLNEYLTCVIDISD